MRLSLLAPTARAKCASARFMISRSTVGKMSHSVRPECGCTKAVEVDPFVALLHANAWSRSFADPDLAQDRFEADAMFVHRPHFNTGLGMVSLDLLHIQAQFFLKASWACGSALA